MTLEKTRLPERLEDFLEELSFCSDFDDRAEILIDLANTFKEVPARISARPFPEENRVPACESEVFLWGEKIGAESLKFHFAVENPQGISAKALAVIIDQTLSGEGASLIQAVPDEVVHQIFGKELSMGKGQGLMSMIRMVKYLASV